MGVLATSNDFSHVSFTPFASASVVVSCPPSATRDANILNIPWWLPAWALCSGDSSFLDVSSGFSQMVGLCFSPSVSPAHVNHMVSRVRGFVSKRFLGDSFGVISLPLPRNPTVVGAPPLFVLILLGRLGYHVSSSTYRLFGQRVARGCIIAINGGCDFYFSTSDNVGGRSLFLYILGCSFGQNEFKTSCHGGAID